MRPADIALLAGGFTVLEHVVEVDCVGDLLVPDINRLLLSIVGVAKLFLLLFSVIPPIWVLVVLPLPSFAFPIKIES